jgi:drug/metabolite transporter (DMT)-like permease
MFSLLSGVYAILAAILWALSSSMLENLAHIISPKELNIFKGGIAILLLVGTSLLLGEDYQNLTWSSVNLLLLSGVIGIGLGDTAYYAGLKDIGSRRALLLFALAPPMTALIAWIFLGETLNLLAWVGIFVTVGGVAWVVTERTPQETVKQEPKILRRGILMGVFASLGQAVGLVLSRSAMSDGSITSLQSAALRLSAGVLFTLGWVLISRQPLGKWQNSVDRKKTWGLLGLTAFIGTYICLWLQQLAVQGAPAGITQTLLSTSPIFILPIAALRGEKVSWRAVLGALISIFGVMLVFGLVG